MDGTALHQSCKLRACAFRSDFAGQVGWQTRVRARSRYTSFRPRCEQGAAWLGDSDLLRLKVAGRNDHGPLNMGPKLQLSLEDAVDMQLQVSPRSVALTCHAGAFSVKYHLPQEMLIVPLRPAQALQKNNEPHADHGIEVLYRYACLPHALTHDA